MVDFKLLRAILKGLLTFIPGVLYLINKTKNKSTHSCSDAEFCYTLWLSVLVCFKENGIKPKLNRIGEIGNGGSFGVGLCALLSGTEEYYSLEIEDIFNKEQNLKLFNEIVLLFNNRAPISSKYNVLNIEISNYDYPKDVITPVFLDPNVVFEIRKDIVNCFVGSCRIKKVLNWNKANSLNLDFVFSRAVMEHVYDPSLVYKGVYSHLNNNAYMFHDIEFHSHGLSNKIDGHFLISNFFWRIISGRRSYSLNRWNFEKHLKNIIESGFEVLDVHENFVECNEQKIKVLNGGVVLARKT